VEQSLPAPSSVPVPVAVAADVAVAEADWLPESVADGVTLEEATDDPDALAADEVVDASVPPDEVLEVHAVRATSAATAGSWRNRVMIER
jgi:hypothetical protein